MKLKPTIYAQLLIESASGVVPSPSTALRTGEGAEGSRHSVSASTKFAGIAKRFWYLLQKNNQYKDLAKVLNELEVEYAKKEGKILAKVFSEKALNGAEIADIEHKVAAKTGQKVIISNIIKRNWGGVEVVVNDKIIDLSSKGKIEKLKQKLSS